MSSNINETLGNIQKMLTTDPGTPAGDTLATGTLVRENLASLITRLDFKNTPLRDRTPRKQGSGIAASWNVMTTIGATPSAFAEGGTPVEDPTLYDRRNALYKEFGKVKRISDRMIAAGASFVDQEAEQTMVALQEVMHDEEKLLIQGDITSNPLEFDGLDVQMVTIIDDLANPLGFRTELIEQAVATLTRDYNIQPTAIYTGHLGKKAINQSLIGDVRVELQQGNEVGAGLDVNFIQTASGKLPIISSFAIEEDAVAFPGDIVEPMYVVTENSPQGNVLYMEDLYGLSKMYLARTGAAVNMMVTECTVFVNRAAEFHVKLDNIKVG